MEVLSVFFLSVLALVHYQSGSALKEAPVESLLISLLYSSSCTSPPPGPADKPQADRRATLPAPFVTLQL